MNKNKHDKSMKYSGGATSGSVDNGAQVKMNCWDFMKCGRQENENNTGPLGVCPASTQLGLHGTNGGINAGRACWAISGTKCNGEIQGTYAQKIGSCLQCDFFTYVLDQQGKEFTSSKQILKILAEQQ